MCIQMVLFNKNIHASSLSSYISPVPVQVSRSHWSPWSWMIPPWCFQALNGSHPNCYWQSILLGGFYRCQGTSDKDSGMSLTFVMNFHSMYMWHFSHWGVKKQAVLNSATQGTPVFTIVCVCVCVCLATKDKFAKQNVEYLSNHWSDLLQI